MIMTVTLNPALDYVMRVRELNFDRVNRSYSEDLHFGGKGINVSVMLARLGIQSTALGFIAGPTGDHLEALLEKEGVRCDFVRLKSGSTRINVKISSDRDLEINARGPETGEGDVEELLGKLSGIGAGDYLVLSGSVPENLPKDTYERILSRLNNTGVRFVVDAEGDLLLGTLKYKPFLVKPNIFELGDLFGVKPAGEAEALVYAEKLKRLGAANVLVSMGENGALLLDQGGGVTRIGAAEGEAKNTVGSGDSMIAGFLA